MPTNKAFIQETTEIAKELGLEITTEGLANNQLAALAKDLRAKKKDADKATAKPKSSRKKGAYYLSKGKAITTRRGILSEGAEIKPEDISGGKEALDNFVGTKHLEKG